MKNNLFLKLIAGLCALLTIGIVLLLILYSKQEIEEFYQPEGEYIRMEEVEASLRPFATSDFQSEKAENLTFEAMKTRLSVFFGENAVEMALSDLTNKYSENANVLREDYIAVYANILGKNDFSEGFQLVSFSILASGNEIDQDRTQMKLEDGDYFSHQGCITISENAYCRNNEIIEDNDYLFHQLEGYVKDGVLYWILSIADFDYTYENAYLLEPKEGLFYSDGIYFQYDPVSFLNCEREQIVSIKISNGEISDIHMKSDKISGKVLSVGDSYIELEGAGKIFYADHMRIYDICKDLTEADTSSITIGYDFCDYVMEQDKIAAVLVARTGEMDRIRVLLRGPNMEGRYYETVSLKSDAMITVYDPLRSEEYIENANEEIFFHIEDYSPGSRINLKSSVLTQKTKISEVIRSQGNANYRGDFELFATDEGFIIINELPVEEYLYAVVPSEMPSSYPGEALKAQAICARTYAYMNIVKAGYPSYGAHVDDSAAYQVYQNISENVNTTQAVKDTEGLLLFYQGEPAQTYYYSTSAGFGNNVEVWNGKKESDFPYMTSLHYGKNESKYTPESLMDNAVYDEYIRQKDCSDFESNEGWYRWTYTVNNANSAIMEEKLAARYQMNSKLVLTQNERGEFVSKPVEKLGELLDIEIVSRLPGGNAREMIVTGSENTFKVITELYIRAILCDGQTKVIRQTGDSVSMPSLLPSGFISLEIEKEDSCVVKYKIYGGGFGHGVGMSQNGAKAMANLGYSTEEILQFYYQDTIISSQ